MCLGSFEFSIIKAIDSAHNKISDTASRLFSELIEKEQSIRGIDHVPLSYFCEDFNYLGKT